ncbi:MAG: YidH family protein [Gammaproteobacteria bacterium]
MPETDRVALLQSLHNQLIEQSFERCYQNAERTLSVWIRTALALMIFGIAIDRFGLFLREQSAANVGGLSHPDRISMWVGAILIALGVLMAVAMGVRFLVYASVYRRKHLWPVAHGPYLATSFDFIVAAFGVALMVVVLAFTR